MADSLRLTCGAVQINFPVVPEQLTILSSNTLTAETTMAGAASGTTSRYSSPGSIKSLRVSGVLLTSAQALALEGVAGLPVETTFLATVDTDPAGIRGLSGKYFIQSIQVSPTKPRLPIDGLLVGDPQYAYDIYLSSLI